jgi:hypothetical protein
MDKKISELQFRAKTALSCGDYKSAEASYEAALRIFPSDSISLAGLAKLYLETGDRKYFDSTRNFTKNMLEFRGKERSVLYLWPSISKINSILINGAVRAGHIPGVSKIPKVKFRHSPVLMVVTCLWGRDSLSKIALEYYSEIRERLAGQIRIKFLACGSEGVKSRSMVEKFDFYYIEHANTPLTEKWNVLLKEAARHDFDALIIVGSDDFLSLGTFSKYRTALQERKMVFGFRDAYFLDLERHDLIRYYGYGGASPMGGMSVRLGEPIGMGRFFSRQLLELLNFNLWGGLAANKGLDLAAVNKLADHCLMTIDEVDLWRVDPLASGDYPGVVTTLQSTANSIVFDVKTKDSLTKFSQYTGSPDMYERIPNPRNFLANNFPSHILEKLWSVSA